MHKSHLLSFPDGIHSWSQTDHLALAQGFINNGFDFFKPETYMLNKVYEVYDNGVTAVDFPINNYLVAAVMMMTGHDGAAPFRLYMLLYSCVGLSFLFSFVYRRTKSLLFGMTVLMLVAGSAVFLEYQDGLIPSMSALSNVFIALYFLAEYWNSGKQKYWAIAIGFLSLAALMRTPFALFMIALLFEIAWRAIRRKAGRQTRYEVGWVVAGLILPVLYFIYNGHLRSQYGTIFLYQPVPPQSWEDLKNVIQVIGDTWIWHYWSLGSYLAIGLALVVSVVLFFKNFREQLTALLDNRMAVWSLVALGGGACYMTLMFRQFAQHDYYILDSLWGVALILFTLLLLNISSVFKWRNVLIAIILALTVYGVRDAVRLLFKRRQYNLESVEMHASKYFKGANGLLERLGIQENALILTADAYAPNLPLVLMKRKGYSVPYPTDNTVDIIRHWDWDYLLLQDYLLEKLFLQRYPAFMDGLERIGGDGRLSVFAKNDKVHARDIFQIFRVTAKEPLYVDSAYQTWNKYVPSAHDKHTGWTQPTSQYDLSHEMELTLDVTTHGLHIVAEIEYTLEREGADIFLVVVLEEKEGKLIDWQAVSLKDIQPDSNGQRNVKKIFAVDNYSADRKLICNIWNPGGNEMEYRNLCLKVYDGTD
ncbi:MAG TPA: hypothetical protein VIK71_09280 [Flavobacteriales bacterium]